MSENEPGVSVVIPTHNRPQKLRALLESIERRCASRLDTVVVVDDSGASPDLESQFPRLNLIQLRPKERLFLSRAKNLGSQACTSPFVYFIDDDNVVTEDAFDRPLGYLVAHPEVGAVMPSVLYKDRPDLVWVYATPLAPGAWQHTLVGRNQPRDARLENRMVDTDALPNASLVRRAALVQVGGFDERLPMSSSADFAIRLKRAGWRVLADTGTFVLHDVEPPGQVGFWASHGAVDPDRVFHDVRDWFLLMRSLHPHLDFFALRATRHALGFLVPNGLVYLVRGGVGRRSPFVQLVRGYLSGLRASAHDSS